MNDKKETKLTNALEEYNNSSIEVIDVIYELIDGNKDKSSVSIVMTKHKEKLRKLEKYLRLI